MLTAVSLFAGVGGFDLALERNGVNVVAAVEIDDNARGVLAHQFPNTQLFPDVRTVTGDELLAAGFDPANGILCGGFPCQDLSVAGKRAGLDGARSGLFWEICRLIDETRPQWLLLENVPGLLSSNGGRDMGAVIGALVDRGYGIGYRILDAQHFGVPQRRRRVVIVGCLGDDGRTPAAVLAISESLRGDSAAGDQAGQEVAGTLGGGAGSRGWAPDTDRMTFVPILEATARQSLTPGRSSIGVGDEGDPMFTLQASKQHGVAHLPAERERERVVYGQTSFAGYTTGPATLTASSYKRPEDSIVVGRD